MQIVKIQETAKFTDFEFLLTILSLHFSASLVASIFVNIPLFQDPLSHPPPPPPPLFPLHNNSTCSLQTHHVSKHPSLVPSSKKS